MSSKLVNKNKKMKKKKKTFRVLYTYFTIAFDIHSIMHTHNTTHTQPNAFYILFHFLLFFCFFNIWSAMTDHMCCRAWMTQSCISLPGHPLNSRKFVFTTINIVNVLAQGKHNKKTPLNFTFKDIITHEQDIAHWKWRLWLSDKTMIIRRNLTERR